MTTRKYTNLVLEMIEEERFGDTWEAVLETVLSYMSEAQVEDLLRHKIEEFGECEE